jgi:FMN phosphatase YigB (HAD superfamily)
VRPVTGAGPGSVPAAPAPSEEPQKAPSEPPPRAPDEPRRAPEGPPKAVVFDLDDTLYDCLGQCVGAAHREAARAMVEAGARATVEEVLEARLALAGMPGTDLDDAVAATFRSTNPLKVAEAGRRAFHERDPGPLSPFPFAHDVLRRVRGRATTVLLSVGHPPTQRRKIASLGLDAAFDETIVGDVAGPHGKEHLLERWLAASGLRPDEVLVVGDRPDAEVAAAARLGMRALRVRGGEHAARPTPAGVPEADDVRAVLDLFPGA